MTLGSFYVGEDLQQGRGSTDDLRVAPRAPDPRRAPHEITVATSESRGLPQMYVTSADMAGVRRSAREFNRPGCGLGTARMSACGRWTPRRSCRPGPLDCLGTPRASLPRSRVASCSRHGPKEDRPQPHCAGRRASCVNRTHDLRITRASRNRSQRSTSTDGTPHSSHSTE
jgi:hypothetical protein